MARYRRRDSVEIRLTDAVEADGRTFSADLIAKRATGVRGYRMTLAFFEVAGSSSYFVDLEPAASREEAQVRAEGLRAEPVLLQRYLDDVLGTSE